MNALRRTLALACLVSLAACGSRAAPVEPALVPEASATARFASNSPIRHIVIVVQENRSFDNIFAGYTGADSAFYGYAHDGTRVALKPTGFRGTDIFHSYGIAVRSWDGARMDGFDLNKDTAGRPAGYYPYSYLRKSEVQPYWTMARRYVLADRMFPTMFGPSFTAHLDLIAGTAGLNGSVSEVDGPSSHPWGCDAPAGTRTSLLDSDGTETTNGGPFPCFTQFRTLADTLDAAHLPWKFYAPELSVEGGMGKYYSPFASIRNVRYGDDWHHIVSPNTRVLTDPAGDAFPAVVWVAPDSKDSDHAGSQSDTGPSWVAAVVNAIGKSAYWKSTAIVIVWDDWGGWYDHVVPPRRDFRGLGIRVPCLIVSPYVPKGRVSHTQYEFGSIVRFVEETFGLPKLGDPADGYTDTRAASISDSFDFTQTPRTFEPIPAKYPASHFLTRAPSMLPPDDM